MRKTATHLAACLQTTEPTHSAYAALHRMERICFDTAAQFDLLLTTELRDKLENIDYGTRPYGR